MRIRLLAAAALLGFVHAAPAAAQRGGAGFDYYLLSLSVAPSFCSQASNNASSTECRRLTEASFRQTPLTIHGLWPNRSRVSVNRQPQNCAGPAFEISPTVQEQLRRYMPAGPSLARYEWRKHGACSGLEPEQYFAAEVSLAEHANQTIGAALLQAGNAVRVGDLLQAVGASDPALAGAIVVFCRFVRGGAANVQEIRLTLDKSFRPIPANSVGLGQNSGCPRGVGRIPTVAP